MENRPVRKRPQRSRYSYNKKYKNNPNETTRLGNQISAAIILCVFVLIIAYTNSSATKNLRDRTAAIISRNVLNEFEDKGNIKDNITGFVKCMFTAEEDTRKDVESEIVNDIKNTSDDIPAQEKPPAEEDTPPE
ncbi:MAG: hypothetical protein SOY97_05225 [Candidatus Metalachnospira sp.]|nr:hypothetical protein [Candidatus Metalachnospira sp.]